eukprot:705587-Pelagomonas_calceolata.AAC.1
MGLVGSLGPCVASVLVGCAPGLRGHGMMGCIPGPCLPALPTRTHAGTRARTRTHTHTHTHRGTRAHTQCLCGFFGDKCVKIKETCDGRRSLKAVIFPCRRGPGICNDGQAPPCMAYVKALPSKGKERQGKHYTTVPAYVGGLAEAKKALKMLLQHYTGMQGAHKTKGWVQGPYLSKARNYKYQDKAARGITRCRCLCMPVCEQGKPEHSPPPGLLAASSYDFSKRFAVSLKDGDLLVASPPFGNVSYKPAHPDAAQSPGQQGVQIITYRPAHPNAAQAIHLQAGAGSVPASSTAVWVQLHVCMSSLVLLIERIEAARGTCLLCQCPHMEDLNELSVSVFKGSVGIVYGFAPPAVFLCDHACARRQRHGQRFRHFWPE